MIKGEAATRKVYINDLFLNPIKSQQVFNHSPDGFAWGYGGSGPAQLALAILLEFTNQETALKLYQDFKRDIISFVEVNQDFELPKEIVRNWLNVKIKETSHEGKL